MILLETFGCLNLRSLVACAAVEGFVVMYLFMLAFGGGAEFPLLLWGSIMAGGVAVAFWYISGIKHDLRR